MVLRCMIKGRAFSVGEYRACSVVRQRIQLGLIHGCLDRAPSADVDPERTDVEAGHLRAFSIGERKASIGFILVFD